MRVQHVWNAKSGLAEDAVVNTFHFVGPGAVDATAGNAAAAWMLSFYDSGATGESLRPFFASDTFATTNKHTTKVYDMEDTKPRAPVVTVNANGQPEQASDGMPGEVALCLSYRGALVSGTNPARRRGRIYIGPLGYQAVVGDTASGQARPTTAVMDALIASGVRLLLLAQTAGWTWSIFSPTTLGSDLPNGGDFGCTPINELLVDNAFDTIRARGCSPTARVSSGTLS